MADIPPFFGLNIGNHSLKISQIKNIGGGRARLQLLSASPTPFGLLANESDKGNDMLALEIKKGIKAAGINVKNCVMAIPENAVFSRLLTLPKVKDEETEEAIHWALKALLPVPLESVNISYLEIDEKKVDSTIFVNWYVVAAPKKIIEKYQDVMEKAGLTLLAIETEALSLARMITFNYKIPQGSNTLIVDMGAESTSLILARNGSVLFSQSITTGSNAITKVIISDFGLDTVQAEKYKVTYGIDFDSGEGKIAKSIEPIIQIILGEASRTLSYLKEKVGGEPVNSVFLTGGGAGLPKLDTYVSTKLGIPAQIVDPLKSIEVDANIKARLSEINTRTFNVAIGLAIKGILP